jgi:hypothetical protein|tara:strand:+ start:85 stop:258 length:174 start_codon:yes stop_codon:yes gene_type:complete
MHPNKGVFYKVLLLLVLINPVYGQEKTNRLDGVEQEIKTLMESYKSVGLSTSVVEII